MSSQTSVPYKIGMSASMFSIKSFPCKDAGSFLGNKSLKALNKKLAENFGGVLVVNVREKVEKG